MSYRHKNSDRSTNANNALNLFSDEKSTSDGKRLFVENIFVPTTEILRVSDLWSRQHWWLLITMKCSLCLVFSPASASPQWRWSRNLLCFSNVLLLLLLLMMMQSSFAHCLSATLLVDQRCTDLEILSPLRSTDFDQRSASASDSAAISSQSASTVYASILVEMLSSRVIECFSENC